MRLRPVPAVIDWLKTENIVYLQSNLEPEGADASSAFLK